MGKIKFALLLLLMMTGCPARLEKEEKDRNIPVSLTKVGEEWKWYYVVTSSEGKFKCDFDKSHNRTASPYPHFLCFETNEKGYIRFYGTYTIRTYRVRETSNAKD